ncbi:MAG: CaiB/BaiF CoA-transferase family protein [Smithella sp.]|jgi:crotonobetainyl-CoA:carnitine CoA-transferase CaiB-like acyl-CoA transferase
MQEKENQNKRYQLEGIKILDLSTQVPGPYCSMLMADLGADVIKIENTAGGDQARLLPYLFNNVNRNKKGISLNLKSSEAKAIFYKMAEKADVILEGFRPGVCKKLNIDYDAIKKINPRVIYCSITGYGQEGPYRDKPGHDINYLGYSGLLSLEGDFNNYSKMPAIPLADLAGSMFAAVSILAAVVHREKTGSGQYIDVSMTAAVFSLIGASLSAGFQGQSGSESLYIPHYGLFKTRDEKFITLGIVHEEHFWKNLCSVIDMADLAGLDLFNRIAKREEIIARLNNSFITKNLDEWIKILSSADVPCGPVYSIEESYSDPQTVHRNSVFEINHPVEGKIKLREFPVVFSESITKRNSPPPAPGMHTVEILHSLGYIDEEIAALIREKIVG